MNKLFGLLKRLRSIKHIEVIIAVLFGLIVLLVFFSSSGNASGSNNHIATTSSNAYVANLENKLCSLISKIDGAGQVEVMLMWDTDVTDKDPTPSILSAVVVSSGAKDVRVKLEIIKSVEALLNLNAKNIEVIKGFG